MSIRLIAVGEYAYEFRQELADALADSVRQHMKAYGVTDVQVKVAAGEGPVGAGAVVAGAPENCVVEITRGAVSKVVALPTDWTPADKVVLLAKGSLDRLHDLVDKVQVATNCTCSGAVVCRIRGDEPCSGCQAHSAALELRKMLGLAGLFEKRTGSEAVSQPSTSMARAPLDKGLKKVRASMLLGDCIRYAQAGIVPKVEWLLEIQALRQQIELEEMGQ